MILAIVFSRFAKGVPYHWYSEKGNRTHARVSGLVDTGSVCCRDYARTETSLACIHRTEEPTKKKKQLACFQIILYIYIYIYIYTYIYMVTIIILSFWVDTITFTNCKKNQPPPHPPPPPPLPPTPKKKEEEKPKNILGTIPWVCYRRRNQWLRLALALFCLPLIWLACVVYLLVCVAEGWDGRRGCVYPCVVLLY